MNDIQVYLFENRDEAFRQFQAGLCPSVEKGHMIGVRTPILRAYAKELMTSGKATDFLDDLPHEYFEEDQLHAFLLGEIKDPHEVRQRLFRFLPFVNNWATCDQMILPILLKDPPQLLRDIAVWLESDHEYTVRFGILMLMRYFLDERFDPDYLERVSYIRSRSYYVNMMIAWYFATALAKQYDRTIPYLTEERLDVWVHNKTISKAWDSLRIPADQKQYLKTLKRK